VNNDQPTADTPDVLPDDRPDLTTPNGCRLALFMEIVKEHKPFIELRMNMVQQEVETEEWDHENMRPRIVKTKSNKTEMLPELVLVRVRASEQPSLIGWIKHLCKTRLGIDYEPQVDSRYNQSNIV